MHDDFHEELRALLRRHGPDMSAEDIADEREYLANVEGQWEVI